MKGVYLKIDKVNEVLKSIQQLSKRDVLIGIPNKNAERKNKEGGSETINNAALGYIHEFGSPSQNIPARPFLVPGVQKSSDDWMPRLKKAAEASLSGRSKSALNALEQAGKIAERGAKSKISDGPFVPLKPSTIANRRKSRLTQSMRKSEKEYLRMIGEGMDPAEAQAEAGIQPLINTGSLRNSITHIIRDK